MASNDAMDAGGPDSGNSSPKIYPSELSAIGLVGNEAVLQDLTGFVLDRSTIPTVFRTFIADRPYDPPLRNHDRWHRR